MLLSSHWGQSALTQSSKIYVSKASPSYGLESLSPLAHGLDLIPLAHGLDLLPLAPGVDLQVQAMG